METNDLILTLCTIPQLERLIEGSDAFETTYGLRVMEGYITFEGALEYLLANTDAESPLTVWGSYLFIHRIDHAVIGFGGFKGAPDAEGMVEIGYGVAPSYQGRGYATQAAQALVNFAFTSPQVRVVCAHTAPEENASTSVLTKIGMRYIGVVHDPHDGDIWRWEMGR